MHHNSKYKIDTTELANQISAVKLKLGQNRQGGVSNYFLYLKDNLNVTSTSNIIFNNNLLLIISIFKYFKPKMLEVLINNWFTTFRLTS